MGARTVTSFSSALAPTLTLPRKRREQEKIDLSSYLKIGQNAAFLDRSREKAGFHDGFSDLWMFK